MSAQGMFSIGGIASGLDTAGIVDQLMQLERQPVKRLERQQAELEQVDEAWNKVNTKLSGLRTAVDELSRAGSFDAFTQATSSNPDAVSVASNGTETGSLSFRVARLAQAHEVASGSFADPDQPLTSAQDLTVTLDGETISVGVDGRTLHEVAAELNEQAAGFSASVVKVADGEHRLLLAADDTGAANQLSVTSDLDQLTEPDPATGEPANGLRTLQEARNAQIELGSGADALTIERARNTIDDLVPGASVTLEAVTTDPVTVTTSRDTDAAASAVKTYVEALNGAIGTLGDLSSYNAQADEGGVLQGDATARQLMSNLRSAVNAPMGVDLGTFSSAYEVGLAVDRNGMVTLDEERLADALATDFDAVGQLFTRAATATSDTVSSASGTSTTAPGAYEVELTQAADTARASANLVGSNGTFTITSGGTPASVTVDDTMTNQDIVDVISAALADAGISRVTAELDAAGDVQLETSRYGSDATFTVEDDATDPTGSLGALAGTHAGVDAAGEAWLLDDAGARQESAGVVVGDGQRLQVESGVGEGLSVWLGDDAVAPESFEVTFAHGLAGGMSDALARAEGATGMVARARDSLSNRIDLYQDRIEGFERRLETRESTLRRQFTAMETAMAELNSQGQWLQSQLGSLSGGGMPQP